MTAKAKGPGGRPKREFDEKDRNHVRTYAMLGLPQRRIAEIMGCSCETLRKHCKHELHNGKDEANAAVLASLFTAARGGNVTAQIFWLKTNAGFSEARGTGEETPAGKLTINLHPSKSNGN